MGRSQKEHDERLHRYSVERMAREAEITALKAELVKLRAELKQTKNTAMSTEQSSYECCEWHLVRLNKGTFHNGVFVMDGHCKDGERIRCSTCHRVWEHVCDEAEGCTWRLRS